MSQNLVEMNEWNAVGFTTTMLIDNILRAHAENAWVIGTIGNVMKPILVNTKLGNVPKEGAHGYDAIRMQPNHPEQFFFRS